MLRSQRDALRRGWLVSAPQRCKRAEIRCRPIKHRKDELLVLVQVEDPSLARFLEEELEEEEKL